jgi:U1 small nuclear ribonucleoprotein
MNGSAPHMDGPGGRGGYGGEPRRNDYDDRSSYRGGGGGGGITGSNREPVRPRDAGGYGDRGYGDRDRDRGYGQRDDSRKRPHESDGYDNPRKRKY